MRSILDQRAEFPNTHEQRVDAYTGRVLDHGAYLLLGAALVGASGVALPRALGLPSTHLAEAGSVGCGLGRDLDVEESMSAARARRRRLSIG